MFEKDPDLRAAQNMVTFAKGLANGDQGKYVGPSFTGGLSEQNQKWQVLAYTHPELIPQFKRMTAIPFDDPAIPSQMKLGHEPISLQNALRALFGLRRFNKSLPALSRRSETQSRDISLQSHGGWGNQQTQIDSGDADIVTVEAYDVEASFDDGSSGAGTDIARYFNG